MKHVNGSLQYFADKRLWWADQNLGRIGTCNKRDGGGVSIVRNKTAGVVHMKLYDKEAQQGNLLFYLNLSKWNFLFLRLLIGILFQSHNSRVIFNIPNISMSAWPPLYFVVLLVVFIPAYCEMGTLGFYMTLSYNLLISARCVNQPFKIKWAFTL